MPQKTLSLIDSHSIPPIKNHLSQYLAMQLHFETYKKKGEFGTLNDELIRDRVVCGIQSDRVRKQLLREAMLTLQTAITICMSNEQSDLNSKVLRKSETYVHYVHAGVKSKKYSDKPTNQHNSPAKQHVNKQSESCYNCGNIHAHNKHACSAFGKQCNKCQRFNHFASVCCKSSQTTRKQKPNQTHINELDESNEGGMQSRFLL